MKLWPSRSSIVVAARRTMSAGIGGRPAPSDDCVVRIELAHLGLDLQVDQAVVEHGRREGEADAVALLFDRDLSCCCRSARPGSGYSPPARKLAVSPDSAVRFGSASVRTRPRCSSALISTSMVVPPAIMRPSMKPNGDAPESTPAATSPIGMLVGLVGAVIGRLAGRLARADIGGHAAVEHVPLHAELAAGLARGLDEADLQHDLLRRGDDDRVDDLRRELARDGHRAVERDRVRARCPTA